MAHLLPLMLVVGFVAVAQFFAASEWERKLWSFFCRVFDAVPQNWVLLGWAGSGAFARSGISDAGFRLGGLDVFKRLTGDLLVFGGCCVCLDCLVHRSLG
ncbi:MAG: hypothetical protein LW629_11560 [Burkholderiales bacterium]|nr:hypothetical protein [Burkholderiales bacterium]